MLSQSHDSDLLLLDNKFDKGIISKSIYQTELKRIAQANPTLSVGIYQRLAEVYQSNGQFDSTYLMYQLALNKIDIKKQPAYLHSVLLNIGNLFEKINQHEQALKYYIRDSSIRLQAISNNYKVDYYYNRAEIRSNLNDFFNAYLDLQLAYKYVDGNNSLSMFELKMLECEILKKENKFHEAFLIVQTLKQSMPQDFYPILKLSIMSNEAYLGTKIGFSKYSNLADSVISMARSINDNILLLKALKEMSDVYELCGEREKAYEVLKAYIDLNNDMENYNKKEAISLAEFNIQNSLTTKYLQLSENSNKLKSNQIVILIVGIVLLLGIIIGGYFFYKQRHQIQKQELLLRTIEAKHLLQEKENAHIISKLSGQINERRRIAMDLHNVLGNRLSSIKQKFESLHLQKDAYQLNESINLLNVQIDLACEKLREISHDQYDKTWMHELKIRLEELGQLHQIKTSLILNNDVLQNFPEIETTLYTISEGLISNTIKYAKASEINIQILKLDKMIHYTFEDNGIGFDPVELEKTEGIGYRIIKEKVKNLNGTWSLETSENRGLTLFINIPLNV